MLLAVQYYRPPFPHRRWWEQDLDGMKAAGLNAVQLWACWGWIEPEPGVFRWDDYDALIEGAAKRGLQVVLSTLPEITPFWVPREFPDAAMIDHKGNPVISTPRQECNVGLTPGGCTDHLGLREAMCKFLRVIAKRYAAADNLAGWDCWNELRWMVNANGHVCFCRNTLKSYRRFLKREYGDLDGLNRAWGRRYAAWKDVYPSRVPGGGGDAIPLYNDTLAWQRFLNWRAADTCRWRYEALREGDPARPILAHCAAPTAMPRGRSWELPTTRGNDWMNAEQLDGYGSSHFPNWGGSEFASEDIGVRIECVRSAAGGKVHWLSELQGGQSNIGLTFGPPVPGAQQQGWVWNGYSRGAKAVIFWCWRDEVFAAESSGFGIIGDDGMAEDRLAHMRRTGALLAQHGDLLDQYTPDAGTVGLLFTPETPMIDWSITGAANQMSSAFLNYARALERLGIPYEIMDANHLDGLDRVKLLIMPQAVVVGPEAERRILDYVAVGGTILSEAWTQAWDANGLFHYTGKERPLPHALGLQERCRKHVADQDGWSEAWGLPIPTRWAVTPWAAGKGQVLGVDADGEPLLVKVPYGAGAAYMLGTWAAYGSPASPDLAPFITALVRDAGAWPEISVAPADGAGQLVWRTGLAGKRRLFFLVNLNLEQSRRVTVTVPEGYGLAAGWEELGSGQRIGCRRAAGGWTGEVELAPGAAAILAAA